MPEVANLVEIQKKDRPCKIVLAELAVRMAAAAFCCFAMKWHTMIIVA